MNKKIAVLGTGLAAGILCAAMAVNAFAAQITEDRLWKMRGYPRKKSPL